MSINIGIVDDHNVVIDGLKTMLGTSQRIKVMQAFNCGADLLEGLKKTQPDVLVMDIQLPDVNGDELTAIVRKNYPTVKVLAMTGFDTLYYVKAMLEKGATGYLLKNTDKKTLIEAIETVNKGQKFIDPSLKDILLQDLLVNKSNLPAVPLLTRREKDVLKLITEEYTSHEIASKLYLSLRTVENYRTSLLQKLHAKNIAGLVKTALQLKLID